MNLKDILKESSNEKINSTLLKILENYLNPAFGSLPKREVDLLMFEVLEDLHIVKSNPDLYSVVRDLRVTRSKARSLLYDRELRKYRDEELDDLVKEALKKPIISKNQDEIKLEIESPLISDHLRARVKKLGFLSDGSFSPSIVTLPIKAVAPLIESYLSPKEKKEIKNALSRAGVPDGSLVGFLKAVAVKVGSKVASDAGEAAIDQAEEYFGPIISGAIGVITERASTLFSDQDTSDEA